MIDFKTWWNFRDGKAITITLGVIVVILTLAVVACEPREEDPNVCTNLCVIDKNGIPRYPDWFEEHPEDKPE